MGGVELQCLSIIDLSITIANSRKEPPGINKPGQGQTPPTAHPPPERAQPPLPIKLLRSNDVIRLNPLLLALRHFQNLEIRPRLPPQTPLILPPYRCILNVEANSLSDLVIV